MLTDRNKHSIERSGGRSLASPEFRKPGREREWNEEYYKHLQTFPHNWRRELARRSNYTNYNQPSNLALCSSKPLASVLEMRGGFHSPLSRPRFRL